MLVAIIGIVLDISPGNLEDTAKSPVLDRYGASQVAIASDQAYRSRWILIVVGLVAL